MIALFFDTETTGVKSYKNPDFVPRLVQLGAILQDLQTGRIMAEVNLIVTPDGQVIPEGAAKVHGITTELAHQFGFDMEQVDSIFAQMLHMAQLVVAHNAHFDLDIVKDNLPKSAAVMPTKDIFCTMEGSRYIVRAPLTARQLATLHLQDHPFKSPNLMETHQFFFSRPFEGAHDAMADIRACRDIFLELIRKEYYTVDHAGEVAAIVETTKVIELRAQR